MANINITSDAWTEISITSGTVQNISATADIELSAEQTDNSGVVLKPSEIYQWDNETIYARAVTESAGALRVVNFKKAAGGGGYVLPVASASTLGGVKVGTNLSIDGDGVLSAPVSYSTTEKQIGTWIDGKPLYQVTFSGTAPATADQNEDIFVFSSISDIDKGFIVSGSLYDESASSISVINESSESNIGKYSKIWISLQNSSIRGRVGTQFVSLPLIVTIQYTKTTD